MELTRLRLKLLEKEKEMAIREAELARRELEVTRAMQANQALQPARSEATIATAEPLRLNIMAIADLLSHFDGSKGNFETWRRQFHLLRDTYALRDDASRILVVSKLQGKVLSWFHSRPEHMELPVDRLLDLMGSMFHVRTSRLAARRQFEERTWHREETFADYLHQKTILANHISVDEEEFIDCLIDGIPDPILQDQARIQRFRTSVDLLEAFGKITLRARATSAAAKGGKQAVETQAERPPTSAAKRCVNCGDRGHPTPKCPVQGKGRKCFQCNEFGHISRDCPTKKTTTKDVLAVTVAAESKYRKEIRVNGCAAVAVLDTGSDVSLIRKNVYIDIGAPPLTDEVMRLRGIGSEEHQTLGKFDGEIVIDGERRGVTLRVVEDAVLEYGVLLGFDFIDTAEWVVKEGTMTLTTRPNAHNTPAEIFYVDHERNHDAIDMAHVKNPEIRKRIETAVREYKPDRNRESSVAMKIVLKDDEPVYQRARRLAPSEREEVNRQIREWLRDGIIQPSLSEYASPIVLVKKKDGTARLCVDYRRLNAKIVRDRYPLPLMEDQLDLLQDAVIYSKLDLRNAFFHVKVEPESRKFTSFIVPDGQYEFLKVPFGLSNSPAVFQRYVQAAFRDLVAQKIVMIYVDDLIVPAKDCETGAQRVEEVLKRAAEYGLAINWAKCEFLKTRVEYLGHIVEGGTVRPSENKTKAVDRFPIPTTVKQVQSFLGLSGYFRKFIQGYSVIARPLTRLLKANERFRFESEELNAFRQLKEALLKGPVLQLYRPERETQLHTDASMHGYGAMLLQRDSEDGAFHPVYFASGTTTAAERRYPSYELEVLAIVRALRKFRVYLLGIPFKIVTDCRAFTLTMRKRDLCVRVARWALLLEEFQYTIEHRSGNAMKHVDALSRNPVATCLTIESEDSVTARIRRAQEHDDDLRKIMDGVKERGIDGYVTRRGLLLRQVDGNLRIVVPKGMQTQVTRRAHEQGHFSSAKTEALLQRDYWFPAMQAKVEKVVRNCVDCILAERKKGRQEGLLHAIEKGDRPLDTYHVDHLGPLPSTRKQYHHIFVVVDAFTKFVWLYATKTTNSAEVVDRLRKQATTCGNPRRIISDRGAAFTSQAFKDYCKEEGIEHVLIVTGVPRGNGQVERVNRTLIPLLTKMSAPNPAEWFKHLPAVQQFLNATPHRSTGVSPFTLLVGAWMQLKDDREVKAIIEAELLEMFQADRDEIRQRAKERLQQVQRENQKQYDKRRKRARVYEEGDLVSVQRTQLGPGLKLAGKFMGPYEVTRVLRNDRYLVVKVGEHEGPRQTSTSADHMKPWVEESEESGEEDEEE